MNFEKLKDLWEDKKPLIISIVVLLGGMFLYFKNQYSAESKSEINSEELLKKGQDYPKSSSTSMSSMQSTFSSPNGKVTVDISGAVKHGGVYTLKSGSRLNDLINVAGGLHERAEIKNVNRAQLLKDQDQIYVPYKGEKVDPPSTNSQSDSISKASESIQSNAEQVHLNSATVADLQKLTGIGQKKAEQIIQFRDQNGGFKQIEDLTKVTGIGEKTFEKLKPQLTL